jgi:IclR family transcriptional regulator, acetate operon repressor
MRLLMENAGETVNLVVEDEGEAVYLAQVECRQMMRAFARSGSRAPLLASAVGKVMLSTMSDKTLSRILHQRGMPRLTPKTITTPSALRAELERVRASGCAVDDEEHAVGLRCIAAPIFDETGEAIAAISASGPTARIVEERVASLGALVLETASAISSGWAARAGTPPPARMIRASGPDPTLEQDAFRSNQRFALIGSIVAMLPCSAA